ncbi:uncharacterized protein LOC144201242 [Stigmatopora nigra]
MTQQSPAYINILESEPTRNRRVSRFTPSSRKPENDNKSTKHVPRGSSTELKKSGGSVQATPEKGAPIRPVKATSHCKWKSSFTPIDHKNPGNNVQEQNSEEKPDLYDPFDGPENSPSDGSENSDWQRSLEDGKYHDDPSSRPTFIHENRQYSEHHRIERSKEEEMLDYRPTVQRVQLCSPTMQPDYEMKEPLKADPGTRRVSRFSQEPPSRVSRDLNEGIIDIARRATAEPVVSDVSVKAMRATSPPQTAQSSNCLSEWKSPKPLDQKDAEDDSLKKDSEKRAELYEPFDKAEKASSGDGVNSRWECGDLDYRVLPPWQREAVPERHRFDTGRLAERRSYSPDRNGLGRRSFSPDTRRYSDIYRRERCREEEIIRTDHEDYEMEAELMREEEPEYPCRGNLSKRARRASVEMDKITINCDLCGIEVSDGRELEKHLESKSHWDTMENIQEQNNYNDMAIAFLQDVMLYKSIKSSRPVDYSLLQGLQENDHMTKVSLFNCAACQVLVSTAEAAVQNHISSPEHIANTKEFDAQRNQASLDKAEAIMKEMKPQFANFMKGFNHF